MTKEELIEHCLTYPGVYEDYPFDEKWTVMSHRGNKKSFALIFDHHGHPCVNLKCEPSRADFLRGIFKEVKQGYHMNKVHWNTVVLDGELPVEELYDMVQHSFQLTKPKSGRGRKD